MDFEDTCYTCGTANVPRPGFVPMCAPCVQKSVLEYRQRCAWSRRLSAMGAYPGKRTKRAARLEAIRGCGAPVRNDNGKAFGTEKKRET